MSLAIALRFDAKKIYKQMHIYICLPYSKYYLIDHLIDFSVLEIKLNRYFYRYLIRTAFNCASNEAASSKGSWRTA